MGRTRHRPLAACLVAALMVAVVGAPSTVRAATTWHVPADFATIQAAIDASTDGDTILVSPGTYPGTIDFGAKDIVLQSTDGPEVTILDANSTGTVVTINAEAGETPTLRGFTVREGKGSGTNAAGGVRTSGGPAIIEGNRITGNVACNGAGGIVASASVAVIRGNTVSDNISNAQCSNQVGGIGIYGSGSVSIRENRVTGNEGSFSGGVDVWNSGLVTISRNLIRGNRANRGGGLSLMSATQAHVENNAILRNTAYDRGGGIYTSLNWDTGSATIVNNSVASNMIDSSYPDAGAAIYLAATSPVRLINNAITGTYATLIGCQVPWGATQVVSHNDVYQLAGPTTLGCGPLGPDNLSVDPGYIDPVGGNLRLRPTSPLIDAGWNDEAPAVDYDGEPRPHDGDEDGTPTVDIGYDEALNPLDVAPGRIDFGGVPVLAVKAVTVTLGNHGPDPVSLTGISTEGTNGTDFSVTSDTCSAGPLQPDRTCTFDVTFQPSGRAERAGTLVVEAPAPVGRRTYVLTGSGADPMALLPTSHDFGTGYLGSDVPLQVTLRNLGGIPRSVTSAVVPGANPEDFLIRAETCSATPIEPGGTCTVSVVFRARAVGPRWASLYLHDQEHMWGGNVALAGTGVEPKEIDRTSMSFGNSVVNAADTPIVLTVTNRGSAPAPVTAVGFSGAHATDFSIVAQTCTGAPIPGGGSCKVTVGFQPKALGKRSVTLIVRGPWPLNSRLTPVTGTGIQPSSRVTWGTTVRAGPAYTWNSGGALGRTMPSGAQRLHLAYVTPRVSGKWVTDSGPYLGVYYTSSKSGSTWKTPKRLNPTSQHAGRVSLAASGARVYVTWVSQKGVTDVSPTAARVLYVRVNSNHGGSTAWKPTIRLTSVTGRVDIPTIAASGDDAHIAWTDSATGSVRVATSRDKGVTWKKLTVGSTSVKVAEGYLAEPAIAVSGKSVVVTWRADSSGTIKARTSADRGLTWGPVETVGSGAISFASVAVRGKRVAVVWTTPDEIVMRFRYDGTWSPARIVARSGAGSLPYAATVALQDPARVGVAWAVLAAGGTTSNLRWSESADNGRVFSVPQTVAASTSGRSLNDWPSIVWPSAGSRTIVWNAWTTSSTDYRLLVRTGTGTFVPAAAAPVAIEFESTETDSQTPPHSLTQRTERRFAQPPVPR